MPDPFAKVGDIASKITNPYSLAALALVLLHVSLYSIDLNQEWKPWLLSGSLLAAVAMLLILTARTQGQPSATAEERALAALASVIECSNLPMYLTDEKLVVRHCNQQLAELFDSNQSVLVGSHVSSLLKRMAARVPQSRREEFLRRQQILIDKVSSDLAPHSEDIEFVDNRDLQGNRFHGLYKVWIHADKIAAAPRTREIGVFVFFRLEIVTEQDVVSSR